MRNPRLPVLFPLLICLTFCACGGVAGNGSNAIGSVKISITPSSSTLQVGQSLQFKASVSGTSNRKLNWLVNQKIGGSSTSGTISSSGLYKAPTIALPGTITITAQSVANARAAANASVSVVSVPAGAVSIAVLPESVSLPVGHSQQFSATVSGTSNTAVNWMVNGASGGNSAVGTVTSSGVYTAPATVPSSPVTVTAQSAAETAASASATVSIMTAASASVSISPTNASVQVSQSQQFSATVSGTGSTAVNWLVSGIPGGNASVGTITSAGLYTAPASVPTAAVVVTAQSSANPSSSASAGVSITAPVSHDVNLSWSPSGSAVAGYNVYRGTQTTGPFTKINSTLETATVYTDNSVVSGTTYYYATTAVNSSGVESGYSNLAQAIIP